MWDQVQYVHIVGQFERMLCSLGQLFLCTQLPAIAKLIRGSALDISRIKVERRDNTEQSPLLKCLFLYRQSSGFETRNNSSLGCVCVVIPARRVCAHLEIVPTGVHVHTEPWKDNRRPISTSSTYRDFKASNATGTCSRLMNLTRCNDPLQPRVSL